MVIEWNAEGAATLRLLPHEWTWLKTALGKVPREPFVHASDAFIEQIAGAHPVEIPMTDWSKPMSQEEPFL